MRALARVFRVRVSYLLGETDELTVEPLPGEPEEPTAQPGSGEEEQVAADARARAKTARLKGDKLEAVVGAAQIAAALQALAAGRQMPEAPSGTPQDPADGDIEKEHAWATRVADAYHSSPIVKASAPTSDDQPSDPVTA